MDLDSCQKNMKLDLWKCYRMRCIWQCTWFA